MSKKRLSAHKHSTSDVGRVLKRHGFIGVALAGGKTDKTCVANLEYYPNQGKIFLSHIFDKIKTEGDVSSDLILYEHIQSTKIPTELLAFNVPLSLPKCMRCKLKCPGYESCREEEILWMWDYHRKRESLSKNAKLFTPYTERCVEQYLAT